MPCTSRLWASTPNLTKPNVHKRAFCMKKSCKRITGIAVLMIATQACGAGPENHASDGAIDLQKVAASAENTPAVTPEEIELARVDLPNGEYVGWYEPAPGLIVLGQSIRYPIAPVVLDSSLSPIEQYQKLAPGADVPKALIDAVEREKYYADEADRLGIDPTVSIETSSNGQGGQTDNAAGASVQKALPDDSACPWSWFQPAYCQPGVAWTELLSFKTGNSTIARNDEWNVHTAMCSYRGAVQYRVRWRTWYDWTTPVNVTRQTGEGWEWSHSGGLDFDFESLVHDATGDGFHHCGRGA